MGWTVDKGKTHNGKQWQARYRTPDGSMRSKSFRLKKDADKWWKTEEANLDRGEWVDPRAGRITFGEWSAKWLAGLHSIKPKTLAGYESLLTTRVLPTFETVQMRRITPAAVREWQTAMLAEVSAARVRQARQVLSAALEVAVIDGLIQANPCARVKPPAVRDRRQLYLTVAEVNAVAEACEARHARAGGLVTMLAYTGMRWGEAVALRWGRIDFDRRTIDIIESATEVKGRLEWGTPKTHEARKLIIPRRALDALGEPGDPGELVFTAPRGGPLWNSNFRRTVWLPAVKAAGVPDGFHVHDLRHTAASLAIASGASIKAVQRMLGHSSASMTLDRYGHLYEEDLETLADKMEARIAAEEAASNVVALRLRDH